MFIKNENEVNSNFGKIGLGTQGFRSFDTNRLHIYKDEIIDFGINVSDIIVKGFNKSKCN